MMTHEQLQRTNIGTSSHFYTLVMTLTLAFQTGCHMDQESQEGDRSTAQVGTTNRSSSSEDQGIRFEDEQGGGEQSGGSNGGGVDGSGVLQTADESDQASSQTWQESEAAQRQPLVDVGGGNRLTLHSQRVITHVEGHRARTLVDQIFYSPYDRQLEGTFRYSLPVGATVSHYALYLGRIHGDFDAIGDRVARQEPLAMQDDRDLLDMNPEQVIDVIRQDDEAWGELKVGRVVSQADGREAFEDTTRRRVDPALVEGVSPNAFQARVFPIQPQGYTRVVFAYEEDLTRVDDELIYTFPLPEDELAYLSYQLIVNDGQGSSVPIVESPLPLSAIPARQTPEADESQTDETQADEPQPDAWQGEVEGNGPGGAIRLRLPTSGDLELITGHDDGFTAFAGRITIRDLNTLGATQRRSNSRVVFVLDTSLSSLPTRFNINRQLLEGILTTDDKIEEFAVLSFDLGAEWITQGFLQNTPENRDQILREIDQIVLEGATRFDAVTQALASADWMTGDVDLFLLSDGSINWGTTTPEQVALNLSRINRVFAYRTGIGAENEALYRTLTKNGGVFSCLTEESISACSTAHQSATLQLASVTIRGVGESPALVQELIHTHRRGDIFEGAEIKFAGEITQLGDAELSLTLTDGQTERELTYPVDLSTATGQLAPRAWAELLVNAMSESGQAELKELIHALAQRYTILTREVVLLVLEEDEDYTRYDLPSIWEATLADVDSILVHLERALSTGVSYLPTLEHVLISINPQIQSAVHDDLDTLLEDLNLHLSDLSLPDVTYEHKATKRQEGMVEASHDPSDYHIYMERAESRFADELEAAAARALSTIVENDPANGVALRLVAYRLYTWGFVGLSAELFTEVLRRRPYEPQSYRDLAYVVRQERPELAALLYEIATRGSWDERFHQLNVLISEEYSLFISSLERDHHPLATRLNQRRSDLRIPSADSDLRVILSWNTDNVDIDLWVTDPSGEKCYYGNQTTQGGGELLDDVVQGFGPERFVERSAQTGQYRIQAHYFGNNGNRLEAETFIHLTVIQYAGTPEERISEYDALLSEVDQVVDMANVQF